VVPLSSAVHLNPWARTDIDMLTHPAAHAARFSPLRASPSTKVMLALMGLEFTRRAARTPLADATYVGVSPGAVRTGNVEQMGPWARRLVLPLVGLFLRPVAEGAAPLLWAAIAPEAARAPGAVFDRRRRRVRLTKAAADAAGGEAAVGDERAASGAHAVGGRANMTRAGRSGKMSRHTSQADR